MALTVERNGWKGQAARLVTAHAVGAHATVAAERPSKWPSLRRKKPSAEPPADAREAIQEATELELARELELAQSRIAGLERRLEQEAAASRALREEMQTLAAAVEDAEKRATDLEQELDAARVVAEQAEAIADDQSGELAQKTAALDDALARMQHLEGALDAAERESLQRAEIDAARTLAEQAQAIADGNQSKLLAQKTAALDDALAQIRYLEAALDAAERELSQRAEIDAVRALAEQAKAIVDNDQSALLAQKTAALDDALARIRYLEAALAAAESECSQRADEAESVKEKCRKEISTLNHLTESMSSRAATAEELLIDVQRYLLANAAQMSAAEEKVAKAAKAYREADKANEQLRASLHLSHLQLAKLERSRARLLRGCKILLRAFPDRATAPKCAAQETRGLCGRGAAVSTSDDEFEQRRLEPRGTNDGGAGRAQANLAELALLLGDLLKRKSQLSVHFQVSSAAALPSNDLF